MKILPLWDHRWSLALLALPLAQTLASDLLQELENDIENDSSMNWALPKSQTPITATAVTRSAVSTGEKRVPTLSPRALNCIQEQILSPLLESETLKDFQPTILEIKRRIHTGDIAFLRDLEKILILSAPVS